VLCGVVLCCVVMYSHMSTLCIHVRWCCIDMCTDVCARISYFVLEFKSRALLAHRLGAERPEVDEGVCFDRSQLTDDMLLSVFHQLPEWMLNPDVEKVM